MRVLVALCLCLISPHVAAVGVFSETDGDVRVLRGESVLAAAPGVEVAQDDIVETTVGAIAQLDMNDGSVLRLGSGTRVLLADYRLDESNNVLGAGIDVLTGWLRFAVTRLRGPEARYDIHSPTLTIGIRGTEGILEAGNEHSGLRLETGQVAVRAADGGSMPVRAGEYVERARAAAFRRVRVAPAAFQKRMPAALHTRAAPRAHLLRQRGVKAREIRRLQPADRERLRREHPHRQQLFERRSRPQPPAEAPQTAPRPRAAPGETPRHPATGERRRDERAARPQKDREAVRLQNEKEKEKRRRQRDERKQRRDDQSGLAPQSHGTIAARS